MWEHSDLAENIEGVGIQEDSGFGGPGWYRSIDTEYEKEGERVLEAAPLAVGAGAVELSRGKAKHTGVSV